MTPVRSAYSHPDTEHAGCSRVCNLFCFFVFFLMVANTKLQGQMDVFDFGLKPLLLEL